LAQNQTGEPLDFNICQPFTCFFSGRHRSGLVLANVRQIWRIHSPARFRRQDPRIDVSRLLCQQLACRDRTNFPASLALRLKLSQLATEEEQTSATLCSLLASLASWACGRRLGSPPLNSWVRRLPGVRSHEVCVPSLFESFVPPGIPFPTFLFPTFFFLAPAIPLFAQASVRNKFQTSPALSFPGTAPIAPLFSANTPSHTSGGRVTFEAGSRTAWHSHPLGQTLTVVRGISRIADMRFVEFERIPSNKPASSSLRPN
jgi:hypothetical protein